MKAQTFSIKQKNRRKVARSIIQGIILFLIVIIIVKALFVLKKYKPYDEDEILDKQGFVALSYFGVDKVGSNILISEKKLDEHLAALFENGYVTITQQDILDYYQEGKALPKKALFLVFEDGRRDTAIFAQKIMEKYNFKASMLFYGNKFELKDTKFLMPKDLKELEESTFWELGTNGYRLEFINIFDRYENYIGEMSSLEFSEVRPYLDRDYNHYLMDYIRDEYEIPKESYEEMEERISWDYKQMEKVYNNELGAVPKLYALMHANSNRFGTNEAVSAVNEKWIKELFSLNFNREGTAVNTSKDTIYDLTRLQVQPYWSTNHLLMRLYEGNNAEIDFKVGDVAKTNAWEKLSGEVEYKEERIILTSEPNKSGLIRLKEEGDLNHVQITAKLLGNKAGVQGIYLGSHQELDQGIGVQIDHNELVILDAESKEELFRVNLDEIDDMAYLSKEEDEKLSKEQVYKTRIKYAESIEEADGYTAELEAIKDIEVDSVEEGKEAYIPTIDVNESGSRLLDIVINDGKLTVKVDNKLVVDCLEIPMQLNIGFVFLEAGLGSKKEYSQRNIVDSVYDGIFNQLTIRCFEGNESIILYEDVLVGWESIKFKVKNLIEQVINWFTVYL